MMPICVIKTIGKPWPFFNCVLEKSSQPSLGGDKLTQMASDENKNILKHTHTIHIHYSASSLAKRLLAVIGIFQGGGLFV